MATSKKWLYRIFLFIFLMGLTTVVQAGEKAPNIDFSELGDDSENVATEKGDGTSDKKDYKVSDPIGFINRPIYKFNDFLYTWIMRPTAKSYRRVVNKHIRSGLGNFFSNLKYPVRVLNNLLQGKVRRSGYETRNFLVNTTVGIFGFMNPAGKIFKKGASNEDMGQTLGHWGVGPGFYLMLPFLGPTTGRDFLGSVADGFITPSYYAFPHNFEYKLLLNGMTQVNDTSFKIEEYDMIKRDAFDPYLHVRDAYMQYRAQQVQQ